MKAMIKRLGNGANGALRLAVSLPDSGRDAECYTQYHSGYYIAEETRVRLMEALRANYGGYELGDVINRDYGEGYTIYTVEVTLKTPLETRARHRGYFPLPISANAVNGVFGAIPRMPILPLYNDFPLAVWQGDSENNNK